MNNPDYPRLAKNYLFQNYARYPITLLRGEGVYLWDEHGKRYLDFLSGIACTPLGHRHKDVVDAIVDQAQQLLHTSNLYYSPPAIELGRWLVEQGGLDRVFFCNSGTEANEAAIKLARKYHHRQGRDRSVILSAAHLFHGRTLGALAATAKKSIQEGFGPMPAGFIYGDADDAQGFCDLIDQTVAAVILEPIQGEGGIRVCSRDFLKKVRARCDETGALLIFDEVQCGIGRTGALFAYERFKVRPDIITLAKGIANGLPLGCVCATAAVASAFRPGDHGTTFGGNPISCRAALVTLHSVATHYLGHINTISRYLFAQLEDLQQEFPAVILEIRGMGLMLGISLAVDAAMVCHYCQRQGLLLNITAGNVLRFLPPYITNEAHVDAAVLILHNALKNASD